MRWTSILERLPVVDAVGESRKMQQRADAQSLVGKVGLSVGVPLAVEGVATFAPGVAVVVREPRLLDAASDNVVGAKQRCQVGNSHEFVVQSRETAAGLGVRRRFQAVPGLPYVGGRRVRGDELHTVAKDPLELGRTIPAQANDVLMLAPGEAVSFIQNRQTEMFTGSIGISAVSHLPDGTWVYAAPLGVDLALDYQGKTRVDVVRLPEACVRLVVSQVNSKEQTAQAGAGLGVHLTGQAVAALEVLRRLNGAAQHAMSGATSLLSKSYLAQALTGLTRRQEDAVIAELTLDLSRPVVRAAYEEAVQGRLSQLNRLAQVPDSGVDVLRSLERAVRELVIPRSLKLFGFGAVFEQGERTETVRGRLGDQARGETLERVTVSQVHKREVASWDLSTTSTRLHVSDISWRSLSVLPRSVQRLGTELCVSREIHSRITSRATLLAELDWVSFALGKAAPATLEAYRARVAKLADGRLWTVGPHNEAGAANIRVGVTLASDAVSQLARRSEAALYDALGSAWAAEQVAWDLQQPVTLPTWVQETARERLLVADMDAGLHPALWMGSARTERMGYRWATQVVDMLAMWNGLSAAGREEKLSTVLAPTQDGRRALAALLRLLGCNGFSLHFQVDSDVGANGKRLDFHCEHVGAAAPAADLLAF